MPNVNMHVCGAILAHSRPVTHNRGCVSLFCPDMGFIVDMLTPHRYCWDINNGSSETISGFVICERENEMRTETAAEARKAIEANAQRVLAGKEWTGILQAWSSLPSWPKYTFENIEIINYSEYTSRPWSACRLVEPEQHGDIGTLWLETAKGALRTFATPEAAAKAALKAWKP